MNALFVGNLSFDAKEDDLVSSFSAIGPVESALILREPHAGERSLGMAFVSMTNPGDARKAAAYLNRLSLGGRPIRVSCMRPDDRTPRI